MTLSWSDEYLNVFVHSRLHTDHFLSQTLSYGKQGVLGMLGNFITLQLVHQERHESKMTYILNTIINQHTLRWTSSVLKEWILYRHLNPHLSHLCVSKLGYHWFKWWFVACSAPGPLFTKPTDALPQNLVKSRSREIQVYNYPIVLTFDKHIGSNSAEMPVKIQSNTIIITSNLAASRLHESWR